mmetsp:Transcript_3779/g.10056  ORF Transcript_3779/g.10056 Transcript_3779/m.10056 type:complete len:242 (-) Transcript_3779:276-1001(-)
MVRGLVCKYWTVSGGVAVHCRPAARLHAKCRNAARGGVLHGGSQLVLLHDPNAPPLPQAPQLIDGRAQWPCWFLGEFARQNSSRRERTYALPRCEDAGAKPLCQVAKQRLPAERVDGHKEYAGPPGRHNLEQLGDHGLSSRVVENRMAEGVVQKDAGQTALQHRQVAKARVVWVQAEISGVEQRPKASSEHEHDCPWHVVRVHQHDLHVTAAFPTFGCESVHHPEGERPQEGPQRRPAQLQ